jgi:RecJ-like exonuclease
VKRKKLILSKNINCLKCNGKGTLGGIGGFFKCDLCKGEGKVKYIYYGQLQGLNEKIIDLQYIVREILQNVIDVE